MTNLITPILYSGAAIGFIIFGNYVAAILALNCAALSLPWLTFEYSVYSLDDVRWYHRIIHKLFYWSWSSILKTNADAKKELVSAIMDYENYGGDKKLTALRIIRDLYVAYLKEAPFRQAPNMTQFDHKVLKAFDELEREHWT